jgi:hypothetical protein
LVMYSGNTAVATEKQNDVLEVLEFEAVRVCTSPFVLSFG